MALTIPDSEPRERPVCVVKELPTAWGPEVGLAGQNWKKEKKKKRQVRVAHLAKLADDVPSFVPTREPCLRRRVNLIKTEKLVISTHSPEPGPMFEFTPVLDTSIPPMNGKPISES
jgi:hypothetical protein